MKEILAFHWRFLTFRASAEELQNLGWRHLATGLLWTWAAGIGRWWDDPLAGPLQMLGVGSIAYVFVLALVLWLVTLPLRPVKWSYLKVLTAVCLTAPPAILYALPVERWVSMSTATWLNLSFLAVVAVWRVGLWITYLRRAGQLDGDAAFAALCLPLMAVVFGVAYLNIARGLITLMGGLRDPRADDVANAIVMMLGMFSFIGFIPVALMYGSYVWHRRKRVPSPTHEGGAMQTQDKGEQQE